LHDFVALAPIVLDHQKGTNSSTIKGFVGSDKTLRTLISSEVVFDSDKFKKGQKLYFRAEVASAPQFRQILITQNKSGQDVEFILMPESMAVGVSE
jgi:hypothetical protein